MNCLVTSLKEAVSDTDLLKLGEMKIHFSNKTSSPPLSYDLVVMANKGITVRALSPGYFTDANGTANLGTEVTLTPYVETRIFLPKALASNGFDVVISDKYSVTNIKWEAEYGTVSNKTFAQLPFMEFDLGDFLGTTNLNTLSGSLNRSKGDIKYIAHAKNSINSYDDKNSIIYGDISSFVGNNTIANIYFRGDKNITGDISSLATLTNLVFIRLDGTSVYGSVNALAGGNKTDINFSGDSNVTGNLSAFSGDTQIHSLNLSGTQVTGNISSLAGCTALGALYLDNTAVTGDTSSLANLTNLTTFIYSNTAITGTWPLT